MPVERIEKIVGGVVMQRADRNRRGYYECHAAGTNVNPIEFVSLDDVANYLQRNPRAGVRMNPGWSKISKSVFIDGVPR